MNLNCFIKRDARIGCVAGLTLMLAVSGCLVTSESHQNRSGNYISDATFNQIKPGQTTEQWVRATLGPPNSETAIGDDGKLLKWSYTERHESSGAVFLIFGGHHENETTHTAYVETHHGVVTSAWRG